MLVARKSPQDSSFHDVFLTFFPLSRSRKQFLHTPLTPHSLPRTLTARNVKGKPPISCNPPPSAVYRGAGQIAQETRPKKLKRLAHRTCAALYLTAIHKHVALALKVGHAACQTKSCMHFNLLLDAPRWKQKDLQEKCATISTRICHSSLRTSQPPSTIPPIQRSPHTGNNNKRHAIAASAAHPLLPPSGTITASKPRRMHVLPRRAPETSTW